MVYSEYNEFQTFGDEIIYTNIINYSQFFFAVQNLLACLA